MLDLVLLTMLVLNGGARIDAARHNQEKLKKDYENLLASLKPQNAAGQHARAVEALKRQDAKPKIEALIILARTGDPNALPLMVPHLESQDPVVRVWAGAAVSQLVEQYTLHRRDPN